MYNILVAFIVISIIIFCIVQKYSYHAANQVKLCYLDILFILLALIMGLRSISVGVDTINYKDIFTNIAITPLNRLLQINPITNDIEIGFILYAKFISIIWSNYHFFLLISALIFCFLFRRFIKRTTKNYFIASVLFISIGTYLVAFNIYRQMLAVALLANGWLYFKDKKYVATFFLSLLAISFHTTAIIFVVAYLTYSWRNSFLMKILPLITILLYISFETLLDSIAPIIAHYNNYLSNHKTLQEANTVIVLWVIETIIALYFIYKPDSNSLYKFIGNMSLLYVVFNLIGLRFNYIERLGLYFSPFIILSFCYLSDIIHKRNLKNIFFLGSITCFLIYFIMSSLTEQYKYTSIFFNF